MEPAKLISIFLFILCSRIPFAYAELSLKNGNFHVSYVDLIIDRDPLLKVLRTYNSKGTYQGIFGFGWSFGFDTFLTVSGDGSIVVHENAGGAENRFSPLEGIKLKTSDAIDKILAIKLKQQGNPAVISTYKSKLNTDATFRNEEWEKLLSAGSIKSTPPSVGTKFKSQKFEYEIVTKLTTGYSRVSVTGRSEIFNEKGQLIRISEQNKGSIEIVRAPSGRIRFLRDSLENILRFSYNNQGTVSSIQLDPSHAAYYFYDSDGMLVKAKDPYGHEYTYRYSKGDGRFNLTQIIYPDLTSVNVSYYLAVEDENVKSVKERDGLVTTYEYGKNGIGLHQWVASSITSATGVGLSKVRQDYFYEVMADGDRHLVKSIMNHNAEITETIYNECCELPVKITRNRQNAVFQYDGMGKLLQKETPTEITVVKYDQAFGKIAMVTKYDRSNKSLSSPKEFLDYSYNKQGLVERVGHSSGKKVRFIYDIAGRMQAMLDEGGRQMKIKYDDFNRLTEISEPSLGIARISYSPSGEVKEEIVPVRAAPKGGLIEMYQNALAMLSASQIPLSY